MALMLRALPNIVADLERMQVEGVTVNGMHINVKLFLGGDLKFLVALLGLASCCSFCCCPFCLVTHLQLALTEKAMQAVKPHELEQRELLRVGPSEERQHSPVVVVLDEYSGMLRSDLEHILGALQPNRIRTVEVCETRIIVDDVPVQVGLVKLEELALGERVRADIQQRVPVPSVAQGAVEGRVAGLGGSPAAGEMDVFPSSVLVGVAAAVGNGPPAPVSDDGGSKVDDVMGVGEDPVGEDGMDIDAPAWPPAGVEAADEGVIREGDPGDFYMKVIAKKFRGIVEAMAAAQEHPPVDADGEARLEEEEEAHLRAWESAAVPGSDMNALTFAVMKCSAQVKSKNSNNSADSEWRLLHDIMPAGFTWGGMAVPRSHKAMRKFLRGCVAFSGALGKAGGWANLPDQHCPECNADRFIRMPQSLELMAARVWYVLSVADIIKGWFRDPVWYACWKKGTDVSINAFRASSEAERPNEGGHGTGLAAGDFLHADKGIYTLTDDGFLSHLRTTQSITGVGIRCWSRWASSAMIEEDLAKADLDGDEDGELSPAARRAFNTTRLEQAKQDTGCHSVCQVPVVLGYVSMVNLFPLAPDHLCFLGFGKDFWRNFLDVLGHVGFRAMKQEDRRKALVLIPSNFGRGLRPSFAVSKKSKDSDVTYG
eukprot:jgi/Tetstr1/449803/TSEL_036867.t1